MGRLLGRSSDHAEGECLKLGGQGSQSFGILEPGSVLGERRLGEPAGNRLVVCLASPEGVGAMELGRVGDTLTVGAATAVRALRQRTRQGEARPGQISSDPGESSLLLLGDLHLYSLESLGACWK